MTTTPEALPDRVRTRLVAHAAEALGGLATDHLPASLKRVATFTPQRRARLGGTQIMTLLESDEDFRERIGVQVRAQHPESASDLDGLVASVDAAALGFLERPTGWEKLIDEVAAADLAGQAVVEAGAARDQVLRLTARVEELTDELRVQRARSKDAQDKLRTENAELRRKLGESRTTARQASERADLARRTAEEAEASAKQVVTTADAELRRLKARVMALEADLNRASRTARADRDQASLRARLLLDTLLQAGQGLRHELGLPLVSGSPADRVAADLAEPGVRTPSGSTSLSTDDPALLRQLLELPGVHVIVDGYNVTKSAWADASLEAQRERLLRGLAPVVARNRVELTVVFDAAQAERRGLVQPPRGVRVLFSPVGSIADDVIRDLVAAEPEGRVVVVVTSDRAVVDDVTRKAGVRAVDSAALIRLLSRS
ncbi:MAG: hypothetical protein JWR35_2017 [Marmoricola sp.]|jgi:predicted RNA-binding protein with PIN domain|nr:hypothetical protein [Marmoricola sp.]